MKTKTLEQRIQDLRSDIIKEHLVDIPSLKIHLLSNILSKNFAYVGMPDNKDYHGIVILHNLADFNPIPEGKEDCAFKFEDFVTEANLASLRSETSFSDESYVTKLRDMCYNLVTLQALATKHGFEATTGSIEFFQLNTVDPNRSVVSMNVGISDIVTTKRGG